MANQLSGKRVALLVANGFEQDELAGPKKALEKAGAKVDIVSPEKGKVKGWKDDNWADEFSVDVALDAADARQFDALVLPGGVINPDKLRLNEKAIAFIKQFGSSEKPIAAICHGPWTLIDAGLVKGHQLTSWASIKIDLTNAGAKWVDEKVVVDGKLITSRKPADVDAFADALITMLSKELASA